MAPDEPHLASARGTRSVARPYIAAAFVLLSLLALLAVPLVTVRTTERLRAEIADVTAPAQRHVQRVFLSLAEQATLFRGYLRDPSAAAADDDVARYREVDEE